MDYQTFNQASFGFAPTPTPASPAHPPQHAQYADPHSRLQQQPNPAYGQYPNNGQPYASNMGGNGAIQPPFTQARPGKPASDVRPLPALSSCRPRRRSLRSVLTWTSRATAVVLRRALLPGPVIARPPPVCTQHPLEQRRPAVRPRADPPPAALSRLPADAAHAALPRHPPVQRPAAAHESNQARAAAAPDARQGSPAIARIARRPRAQPGPRRDPAGDQLDPHQGGMRPPEPGQGGAGRGQG
jgi:hypothetical protein